MGEQSNAYRILLRYDRKSRHRRIKKQRRYERLAATSQFFGPWPSPAGIARTLDHGSGPASYRAFKCRGGTTGHLWVGFGGHTPATIPRTRCNADPKADLKEYRSRGSHTRLLGTTHPCGNFSGTSSLKFRGTKGSIGHTFMVCIHTENQNQGDFYPFVLLEISVLHESPLGHLRYGLTDVPPQPNSPPDNVFNPDRPARDLNARSWAVKPSSASLNK